MKITYYIDAIFPAQSANTVNVMRMCQAFSKLGHDVTLYCDSDTKTSQMNEIWHHYGTINRFKIKQQYIPKLLLKYGHRLSSYYSAWRKAIKKVDADFVYSRSAMTLLFLKSNITYMYEAHVSPDAINYQIEKHILRKENCKGLVVISQALKDEYKRLFPFLSEEKIIVLHDGADSFEFNTNEKIELAGSADEIKIGYLGQLFPGKCMETLLPIADRLKEYNFHVVGGTEYWVNYWKEEAKRKDIRNIIFYGYVNNSDVAKYYNAFDICVLPFSKNIYVSKNKRVDIAKWTSPIKLFESMASGKPMVVSRLATIEEVLIDNEDCIFAKPDDADDWCDKLKLLIGDCDLQKKLSVSAKKKLEEKYTWEKRCEAILNYVNKYLKYINL